MSFNYGQIFEHDDILELVVAVEVIAHLLHKSCFANVIKASDMHKWAGIRHTRQSFNNMKKLCFLTDIWVLVFGKSDKLTSHTWGVNNITFR